MHKISDKLQIQVSSKIKGHDEYAHQYSISAHPVLAKGAINCRLISTDRKMMDYFYQSLLPITQSDWKRDKLK